MFDFLTGRSKKQHLQGGFAHQKPTKEV